VHFLCLDTSRNTYIHEAALSKISGNVRNVNMDQGCQIFLGALNLNWKIYQTDHKIYQKAVNYTQCLKNQIVIKFTKILNSKAFKSIPKLEFLVRKNTLIWTHVIDFGRFDFYTYVYQFVKFHTTS
jgi:hypothetical protein